MWNIIGNSVERNDLTGNAFEWLLGEHNANCIRLLGENIAGQGYWVSQNQLSIISLQEAEFVWNNELYIILLQVWAVARRTRMVG